MTAAAIVLRLAHARDAHVMSTMSRDLIETGLGWRYGPDRMAALIHDPDTIALVACQHGRVAGFAVLQVGDERAHLILLAVQRDQHRRGVGRRLVDWLVASAGTAGVSAIDLELRVGNTAARAFYRSLGFVDTRLIDGYYSGHESAMRMMLTLRTETTATVAWRPPTRH